MNKNSLNSLSFELESVELIFMGNIILNFNLYNNLFIVPTVVYIISCLVTLKIGKSEIPGISRKHDTRITLIPCSEKIFLKILDLESKRT
jgi:hypothetical protein